MRLRRFEYKNCRVKVYKSRMSADDIWKSVIITTMDTACATFDWLSGFLFGSPKVLCEAFEFYYTIVPDGQGDPYFQLTTHLPFIEFGYKNYIYHYGSPLDSESNWTIHVKYDGAHSIRKNLSTSQEDCRVTTPQPKILGAFLKDCNNSHLNAVDISKLLLQIQQEIQGMTLGEILPFLQIISGLNYTDPNSTKLDLLLDDTFDTITLSMGDTFVF